MRLSAPSSISLLCLSGAFAAPTLNSLGSTVIQRRNQRPQQAASNGKAVYVITNEDQNAVAAIAINKDGTLGDANVAQTGGSGSVALDAKGKPAVPDALVGQGSLTVAGQNLFAVNAGSNTISMFAINPNDPTQLQSVGNPAALPGTFPNTVAASAKHSLVCVGMTGSKAGISCANFDNQNGIGQMDGLRVFDIKQSDPPVGPTNTVSQTFFSQDENTLFTTVKGNPAVNNTGFLSSFSVKAENVQPRHNRKGGPKACSQGAAASLATKDVRTSPAGTAVLFGSAPIPNSSPTQIFATDASFGAGILTLGADSQAQLTAKGVVADQKATCWSTISTVTNTAFVTDVGINRILEMSLKDASIINTIDLSKVAASQNDPGLIDLKTAGNFVYALSPGNGTSDAAISVVDVNSKQLVQHATLASIGVKSRGQGMAVLL